MPPQPGLFQVPYASGSHKTSRISGGASANASGHHGTDVDMGVAYHHATVGAGPSGSGAGGQRSHGSGMVQDDGKKEKKRKDISGKLGKEINDRRDDGRHIHETLSTLHQIGQQLSTQPAAYPLYNLRLLPLTIERASSIATIEWEERYAIECAETAYEDEQKRVEDELTKGRAKVRERLLEGIEERRRRAREEKDGEGALADASLDAATRPHLTRKLRRGGGGGTNSGGGSPPPSTPHSIHYMGLGVNGTGPNGLPSSSQGNINIQTGPFHNPHSLAVDELPSPFPLPLTFSTLAANTSSGYGYGGGTGGGGGGGGGGGRRKPKGNGANGRDTVFGKSLWQLGAAKDTEIENDLNEIRRGNKRRRATAMSIGKVGVV